MYVRTDASMYVHVYVCKKPALWFVCQPEPRNPSSNSSSTQPIGNYTSNETCIDVGDMDSNE